MTTLVLSCAVFVLAAPPAGTFSSDQAFRKLIDRLNKPNQPAVVSTTTDDSSDVPTRDRTDAELVAMLDTFVWVRQPPRVDPPLEITSPWHHPAVTTLSQRCRATGEEGERTKRQLINAFVRARGEKRFLLALIFADLLDDRGIEELSGRLIDPKESTETRTAAACAVGRFPHRLDAPSLAVILEGWVEVGQGAPRISEADEPLVAALAWCYVQASITNPQFDPTRDRLVGTLSKAASPNIRKTAALAFAGKGWNPLPQIASDLTGDNDPRVRQAAVVAVTNHPSAAARALVFKLSTDNDPLVATESIRRFALYPDLETTARLAELWTSSSAAVREAVLEAAGALKNESILLRGVVDPQASVRIAAARALAAIPHEASTKALAKLASDDRSTVVQSAALQALAQHPPARAVPLLLQSLDSAAVRTRVEAARLLVPFLPSASEFPATDSSEVRARHIAELRQKWDQKKNHWTVRQAPTKAEDWVPTGVHPEELLGQWLAASGKEREVYGTRLQSLPPAALEIIENFFLSRDEAPPPEFMDEVLAGMDPAYRTLARLVTLPEGEATEQAISTLAGEFENRPLRPLQSVILSVEAIQSQSDALWLRLVPLVRRDGSPVSAENQLVARALDALSEGGMSHPNEIVREATCLWLAEHPNPQWSDRLAQLMNDPSERVKKSAIRAAGATADKDVVGSLKDALRSSSPQIQLEAAGQLLAQGDREGLDHLRRLFVSPELEIRKRVVDRLAEHPEVDREETLRLLTRALGDDKLEVKERAITALERVVGSDPKSKTDRAIPLEQRVTKWKRTMATYFTPPESEEKLRHLDRLREAQEKLSILPVAN